MHTIVLPTRHTTHDTNERASDGVKNRRTTCTFISQKDLGLRYRFFFMYTYMGGRPALQKRAATKKHELQL